MQNNEINTTSDLYDLLDNLAGSISWEEFYEKREQSAPFLLYNQTPDQFLIEFLQNHTVENALEFGCGEGRNAIYLAQNGVSVEAYDRAANAIGKAREFAAEKKVTPHFHTCDIFRHDFPREQVDLVCNSGLFHHLAPHRRLAYRDLVHAVLKPGGTFLLMCFAWGEGGGDDVEDCDYYREPRVGVSFRKERLVRFFERDFHICAIEKGREQTSGAGFSQPYMFECVFQKK